ncbi:MAG TPA: cytochrome c peroxidase [Rhodanobacteraceae bacterium]|nr:cytochrome c peroxidase [Rhodanobacteraceae bacterium]
MRAKNPKSLLIAAACILATTFARADDIDAALRAALAREGFTGRVQQSLEQRLGRPLDARLARLGRLAFHDPLLGLHDDNACAGCHAAPSGFGDTQSIAIGIENNAIVGPHRAGPRNQRRTPMLLNNAFYPRLMWNSRFRALSGDPFDNSEGFEFPPPEGLSLSGMPNLLTAQAFIPPTERSEMAGFEGIPDTNDGIRAAVVERLNANAEYLGLFADVFAPHSSNARHAPPPPGFVVTYEMLARAIAEFEFTLTFADAPLDRFARGQANAMTQDQKRGALVFFNEGRCVRCHAVAGISNEMFSDFEQHVIGVPQLVPDAGNVPFDGPGANEDFGLEQVSGDPADRYLFRTAPLRNLALQPSFLHDGAYTRLEDAIRHHLDVVRYAHDYDPAAAGVDQDLGGPIGPLSPILARLDPLLRHPAHLGGGDIQRLTVFVRDGLHDPRATPAALRALIPARVPSGRALPIVE